MLFSQISLINENFFLQNIEYEKTESISVQLKQHQIIWYLVSNFYINSENSILVLYSLVTMLC